MRRTANGTVLAAAVALVLTGCGSGGSDDGAGKGDGSSAPSEAGGDNSKESGGSSDEKGSDGKDPEAGGDGSGADDAGGEVTREVTLEVSGDGDVIGGVVYLLNEMKTEQLKKLPWTKTAKLPLRGAEVKVGRAVTVTPPSIQDASGRFVPAKCVIKVDGKTVADNSKNAKGDSSCKATVK